MKTYLAVPYTATERAKTAGAKFDFAAKQWYCPDGVDLMNFIEWLPGDLAKWKTLPTKKRKKGRK